MFFWRVLRGILPDESTLMHRHIRQQNLCKICMASQENLLHALLECSHAGHFWEEAQQLFDFKLPRLHPVTWAEDIICYVRFTSRDRAVTVSVMWAIWHSRNRLTHGEDQLDPASSVRRTREALSLLEVPRQLAMIMSGHGWRPPEEGFVTINTDAAIKREDGKGGAGGVARSSCSFLGAWSKPYPGVTDPFIAEAMAVRDGVIFACLRGYTHVIMEMDCSEVANLWTTRHDSRSVVAPILLEIGELSGSFTFFDIRHIVRSANGPAHICAKQACTIDVTESWIKSTPSFLISSLLADCSANAFVELDDTPHVAAEMLLNK